MLARMSKKALALLMVFCMVVSALSVSALAIELPSGEYEGNFAFEYHITGTALDEMIAGSGYTRNDLSQIKLFFNGGAEKEITKLPGQDTYMCSIFAWELEEKAAQNITMLSLTLNNGETSQVLTFGNENLKAVYYNSITDFYELELSDSGSTEPTDSEQSVYVYLKAVDGLGKDNGRGYITVGEIKMNLPAANAEYRNGGEKRYAQYAGDISTALAEIVRYNNNTIDLSDVDWYTLHCASGADGYVENQEAWHLDGEVRVYNVNYHHNNGTDGVSTDPNGYMAGESFTAMTIENLSYEGHTLLGWSTDPAATAPDASFAIPAEGGNVDLYAVWQLDEPVTETYDAWFFIRTDGVIPVETGSTDYDSGNYTPAHNTAVALKGKVDGQAVWTEYSGVITADGTIDNTKLSDAFASVASHIKGYPTDAAIAAALNGKFDPETQTIAWYVIKEKKEDMSSSACPGWHVDGVVYTKGSDLENQFRTLTYYMNDSTTDVFKSELYVNGTDAVVKAGPTRKGYTFTGWNTKADGSGTSYKVGAAIEMTADVDLYAQWTKDPDPQPTIYTVTFKTEAGGTIGGGTADVTDTYAEGADFPSVPATVANSGYTFDGWYDENGTKVTTWPETVTANATYTAKWSKEPEPAIYTVTFKTEAGGTIGGGTDDVTDTYTEGADFPSVPATVANSGYTFDGWYDENGTKVTTWPETVTANATYIAKWVENTPTPDPGPTYNYYRVTVNYLDRADGSKIAESYVSPSHIQGYSYDVSAYDAIAINGYTYDATEGDPVTGTLNSNKTINVYYMADGTEIDDDDTPTSDLPDLPGEGGEVDIDDGQTPTSDLPDTGENGNTGNTGTDTGVETEIVDEGTPTGNLPQTGTMAQTSATRMALGALALTTSLMAAGLALVLFRKSRKA